MRSSDAANVDGPEEEEEGGTRGRGGIRTGRRVGGWGRRIPKSGSKPYEKYNMHWRYDEDQTHNATKRMARRKWMPAPCERARNCEEWRHLWAVASTLWLPIRRPRRNTLDVSAPRRPWVLCRHAIRWQPSRALLVVPRSAVSCTSIYPLMAPAALHATEYTAISSRNYCIDQSHFFYNNNSKVLASLSVQWLINKPPSS
jgi:hypothetical protein